MQWAELPLKAATVSNAILERHACVSSPSGSLLVHTCRIAEVAFADQHRLRLSPVRAFRGEGEAHLPQAQPKGMQRATAH